MKKKILLILILLIIGGGGFWVYHVYDTEINIDTIYSGIKIEEFNVGEMVKEEALDYIKESRTKEINEKFMKLEYKDNTYDIGLKDIGYRYDYEAAVDKAYQLGREGKVFERYKKIKDLEENSETISLESKYDHSKIEDITSEIADELYLDSKDAVFHFNNGNMNVEKERVGRKVDDEKLVKLIESNIKGLEDIEIPVDKIKPKYTEEYYLKINGIISQFSTKFKNSSPGRKKNIELSAKEFNGVLLHSGETLSYNKTTGPINKEVGYKEAPVIIDGEYTPGVGGGICQTSTTLYNAALLADLTIVERHPHSIPPNYIEKGKDAAVAGDYLDLKFKNDYDFPVYIKSKVKNDEVYLYIYGDTTKVKK
ncbi:MAG TPA: VanW family protein [Tissierellaceae bacterium]|nr:VanW family protein [Tissierellaceae bacterium]